MKHAVACHARRALGIVLALATSAAAAAAPKECELFRIERSTNRNVVVYDVRLAADGKVDHSNPVSAHWRLLAEDGRLENLTWLESQLAYGFNVAPGPDGLMLKLKAVPRRAIRIVKNGSDFGAELVVGGKRAILHRIWVQAEGSLLGPHVRFIELHATDERTGAPVVERIVNG